MKEFEKWWYKNKVSLFCPALTHRSRSDCEKVWKAALEEILKQLKQLIYSADIMAWIEKELKDE